MIRMIIEGWTLGKGRLWGTVKRGGGEGSCCSVLFG